MLAINLMGSPGAGQDRGARGHGARARGRGSGSARSPAISRPIATRSGCARAGIPSVSITTGSACHLDAELVHRALHGFPAPDLDVLFIENVGNLVCPAVYDLGQAANVVALSVTEGEDKPLKYPVMFRKADLVLLTKIDLLPHLADVRIESIEEALLHVMPSPHVVRFSARSGEGLDAWIDWLQARRPFRRATGPSLAAVAS